MKKIILSILVTLFLGSTIFGMEEDSATTGIKENLNQQLTQELGKFSSIFQNKDQLKQIINLFYLRKKVLEKMFLESCIRIDNSAGPQVFSMYFDIRKKLTEESQIAYNQAEIAYSQADDIVKKCIDFIETFFEKSLYPNFPQHPTSPKINIIARSILTYNSIRPLFAIKNLPEKQYKKFLTSNAADSLTYLNKLRDVAHIYITRDEYKVFINGLHKLFLAKFYKINPQEAKLLPTPVFELENAEIFDLDLYELTQIANFLHLATLCKAKQELNQFLKEEDSLNSLLNQFANLSGNFSAQKTPRTFSTNTNSQNRGTTIAARLKAKAEAKQTSILLPQLLSQQTISEANIINQINNSELHPEIKAELVNILNFETFRPVKLYLYKAEEALALKKIHCLKLVPEVHIETLAEKCLKDPGYLNIIFQPILKNVTPSQADTKKEKLTTDTAKAKIDELLALDKKDQKKKAHGKNRKAKQKNLKRQRPSRKQAKKNKQVNPASDISCSSKSITSSSNESPKNIPTPQEIKQNKEAEIEIPKQKEVEPLTPKIEILEEKISTPKIEDSYTSDTIDLPLYVNGTDIATDYGTFGHILDLERGPCGGYQNQIFINKATRRKENYLANITYSREVTNKMLKADDNNHSFSTLVEQKFGQYAFEATSTPLDANSKEFKDGGYKYKFDIKILGTLASLGCPFNYIVNKIQHGESIANGEFEFIVLYNPETTEKLCIHRFFRPYK